MTHVLPTVTLAIDGRVVLYSVWFSSACCLHALQKWLVILTIAFVYHQLNCNCDMVLRDDARLVPCDSHLWAMWAMQPLWSTATIEIHPQYKDPCHCKNWLATLITLWLPYRFTWKKERCTQDCRTFCMYRQHIGIVVPALYWNLWVCMWLGAYTYYKHVR